MSVSPRSASLRNASAGTVVVDAPTVSSVALWPALLAGAMLASQALAGNITFVVNSVLDQPDVDTSDTLCQTISNTCSLRAAIMQANHLLDPGSATVSIPPGTYLLTRPPIGGDGESIGDLNLTAPLAANQRIILFGSGATSTIIDANQISRVLRIDAGRDAIVVGVTIRNGYRADGGGISNSGTLLLSASVIEGNRADFNGGGIFNGGGVLNVFASTIRSNVADFGGGISVGGRTTVRNSTLNGNSADFGGGIHVSNGPNQLSVVDSTISGNFVYTDGGGIANYATTELFNTSVVGNDADRDQDQNGGAGGGVYNNAGDRLVVVNTLIADNTLGNVPVYNDCYGTLEAYGCNLLTEFSGCTIPNFANASFVSANTLGPLQDNGGPSYGSTFTHALLPGSEAIDGTFDNLGCVNETWDPLLEDQRGGPRVAGVRCDVGAFEYGAVVDRIFRNGFD